VIILRCKSKIKGVNEMKNNNLKRILIIALGVIILIAIILINFNLSVKAVNNCISNGQDANVCNELWK